jgi:hypothetical protein
MPPPLTPSTASARGQLAATEERALELQGGEGGGEREEEDHYEEDRDEEEEDA